jgi:hypothetical protein
VSERNNALSVKDVKFIINKKLIMAALVITALSFILAGCLAYYFSNSIYSVFWSLLFGVTLGVMINYFILTSFKIIKKIDIEVDSEYEEEPLTIMKFD